ncbi:MAG: XdhC family protein [Alphaproteobacteria bacterium]|nr:XdhC family protein [Alphaproteobacteria bacterium]
MKREVLAATLSARRHGLASALVRDLKIGTQAFVSDNETTGDLTIDFNIRQLVLHAISEDRPGRLPDPYGDIFVQVFNPPARLIVIGAVHITQALAPMAALAGYGVTVIDPRRAFATDQRFPGITLLNEWPDDGLEALKPDRRTAVVTLTHDPKLDDAALSVALKSQCFYVGSLGSRKTHQARLNRLKRMGFSDAELARIHGPVGLAIGALTPAEIAVSILGQITQVRRARPEPASAAA